MNSLDIKVLPNTKPKSDEEREAILDDPSFGTYFTDNMVISK